MCRTVERLVSTCSGLRSVYLIVTLSPFLITVPDVPSLCHLLDMMPLSMPYFGLGLFVFLRR